MDAIFVYLENSRTYDPNRLLLDLADEIDLKKSDKYIALSNLSICFTLKNIQSLYENNKFKISAPTWNDKFELVQDYLEYNIKNIKH